MTTGDVRRRRDPERRRQEIVEAAAELVTESGSAGLSHRAVAARAGVPLGSTTQYFKTLDDLRGAALARLAQDVEMYVAQVAEAMAEAEDPVRELAIGLHEYLSNPLLVRAEAMLSAAAVVNAEMRSLTDRWFEGLGQALTSRLGAEAAARVLLFISGATWHAALNDGPPTAEVLMSGVRALCGDLGEGA
jgi:DNA-binding transcriptional regulator YbjK